MEQIPKICLNMIIKNESKIITRLLDTVLSFIDHYVICDTGSTDNTIQVLEEYFKDKSIKGKVVQKPFEDFGKTRTYALKQCENEPDSDYVLLLDADMKLEFSPNFDKDEFKKKLTKELYFILQGTDSFQWNNARIVKNNVGFYYNCPTHEYIDKDNGYTRENVSKDELFIRDIGDGGCKDDKFERDIRLLENALIEEPDNCRYLFYLGNSYKDSNQHEKAIEYYKRRIDAGGWYQEIAMSYNYIGHCYRNWGKMGEAINAWLEGFNFLPKRIEGIYEIIQHYRCNEKHLLANYFYEMACKHRYDIVQQDELFLKKEVYDTLLDYEYSIICFYVTKDFEKVNNVYATLFNSPNLESNKRDNMLSNFKFYANNLSNYKCDPLFDLSPLYNVGKNIKMNHNYEFHPSTPSICLQNNKIINVVRYVNYYIDQDGHYKAKNDSDQYIDCNSITTRNMCSIFDITNNELILQKDFELGYNDKLDGFYKGTEDIRITAHNDSIEFTGNKITQYGGYGDMTIHIEHGRLNEEEEKVESCLLNIENKKRIEKNWVLFTKNNESYIIYQWHPLKIYKLNNHDSKTKIFNNELQYENTILVNTIDTPKYLHDIRGSTNGITIGNEIWFINHIVSYEANRYYYHLFVVLDIDTLKVKRASKMFTFDGNRVEYTLGFCYFEKEEKFLIGYSKQDANHNYYFVSKNDVEKMMINY